MGVTTSGGVNIRVDNDGFGDNDDDDAFGDSGLFPWFFDEDDCNIDLVPWFLNDDAFDDGDNRDILGFRFSSQKRISIVVNQY